MQNTQAVKANFKTVTLVRIGLLATIATILMYFDFPLPFFPPFLKIDASEVPVIIGTFAMGPWVGVLIELVKNLVHFVTKTSTAGVGEIANFIIGCSYIIPLGLICRKNKSTKVAVLGLVVGSIIMIVVASILNYVFLIPFYATVYGAPVQAFVDMTHAVNAFVTDFKTLILFGITPFNILKCIMISVLGFSLYRLLKPILINKQM